MLYIKHQIFLQCHGSSIFLQIHLISCKLHATACTTLGLIHVVTTCGTMENISSLGTSHVSFTVIKSLLSTSYQSLPWIILFLPHIAR